MHTERIYALMLADRFVYVGRSVNMKDRVHAHRARGIEFDSVVTLAEVGTSTSEEVEAAAIKVLAPSKNKRRDGRGRHSAFRPHRLSSVRVEISSRLAAKVRKLAAAENRSVSNWIHTHVLFPALT